MSERPQFNSYDEFWLFYVREHSSPLNRWLHFTGTTLAIGLLVLAVVTATWWLLVAVPIAGYALAWIGHFFVEKNKPASFKYPGLSFASDLRMWALILIGRMGHEIDRAGASHSGAK